MTSGTLLQLMSTRGKASLHTELFDPLLQTNFVTEKHAFGEGKMSIWSNEYALREKKNCCFGLLASQLLPENVCWGVPDGTESLVGLIMDTPHFHGC